MPRNTDPTADWKQTVYHSQLAAAGPIDVTITGEPHESKFDKSKIVVGFKYDGREHFYQCENDDCEDALKGYKGVDVILEAKGGRDNAEIIVEEGGAGGGGGSSRGGGREERSRGSDRGSRRQERDEPRQQQGRGNRSERQPEPEDRATTEANAIKKARMMTARATVLMGIAFRGAVAVFEEHFGPDIFKTDGPDVPTTEDVRAVAITLFIEAARGTDISKLPMTMPDPEPKKAAREPEQRQERQREEPRREEPPRRQDPDADAPEDDIPF